ncbi:MAG: hypothetical protein ACO1NW_02475 [Chitinophagaceae bacterium]
MKRIVSWAAIVMLAFSTYLNVFLSLDEMEETTASAAKTNTSDTADKIEAGNKTGEYPTSQESRVAFKTAR